MDKIAGLIANIETAIRYFLTGVVATTLYALSASNPTPLLLQASENQTAALLGVILIGSVTFIFYRMAFWVVGDWAAWKLGISIPKTKEGNPISYAKSWASFIQWRYNQQFNEKLSGYLTYRWAACHFTFISSVMLFSALLLKAESSLLSNHTCKASVIAGLGFILSVLQFLFLFKVEQTIHIDQVNTDATNGF